jgi:hypothetical protein
MEEMPKGTWVASMESDNWCVPFPIPYIENGECVGVRPLISNKPDGLISVLQNHDFAKLIGVKMVTSKVYTAKVTELDVVITVEPVVDHLRRVEAHNNKEQSL